MANQQDGVKIVGQSYVAWGIVGVVATGLVIAGVTYYFGLWGNSARDNLNRNLASDEEEKKELLTKDNDNENPPPSNKKGAKTTMTLKNQVKNDSGVVKQQAQQTYEETFALAVKQGKMTQERADELLAKVIKVASNDATVFAGVEQDIKVVRDNDSGDIIIDMVVHFIMSDENENNKLNFSYASCNSTIKNASIEQQEKACELMHRIIESSLKGMKMENGEEQRA